MYEVFGWLFICGLCIVLGVLIGIPDIHDYNMIKESRTLIEECEYDLPRNQHCEIKLEAVVVDSD